MGRNLLWMSLADGSYGGCEEDMLVTIYEDEMTVAEYDALAFADSEGEVADILLRARDRIETEGVNVEITPLYSFIITTRMGERHWQAEDEEHAREQHYDMFGREDFECGGDDEEILKVEQTDV